MIPIFPNEETFCFLAEEESMIGFWSWNISEKKEYINVSFKKLLGYADNEIPNEPNAWMHLVEKEDLPVVLSAYQKHVASKGSVPYEILTRYKHKNGNTLHLFSKGKIVQWDENGNPAQFFVCHVEISGFVKTQQLQKEIQPYFPELLHMLEAGYFIWHLSNNEFYWSDSFYTLLHYAPGALEPSFFTLVYKLIHADDRNIFLSLFDKPFQDGGVLEKKIRMQTKEGFYESFLWKCYVYTNEQQEPYKVTALIARSPTPIKNNYPTGLSLLNQLTKETKTAAWKLELASGQLEISSSLYELLELPHEQPLTLEQIENSYPAASKALHLDALNKALLYKQPQQQELQITLNPEKTAWFSETVKSLIDEHGNVTSLLVVLQNIDKIKEHEEEYKNTIHSLSEQNKRLITLSHTISHDLSSYTGNIQMILEIIKSSNDENEKKEFFKTLNEIANVMSNTLSHLNEVIKIQAEARQTKTVVHFQDVLNTIQQVLKPVIEETQAIIETDFSAFNSVEYIPAYMESILLNLVSNALKYRHPQRQPHIHIQTTMVQGKPVLQVSDNGLGIDLAKYKNALFGLNKTFHSHKDAHGVGLFITKNQVEALGGHIEVESEPNQGTTFTIFF